MNIHKQFMGGNIQVCKIEGTEVWLQNELRDTMEDWFYWAFCVEGAQGQTVTFHFDKKWLGYYGPAVSHDLIHWHWMGAFDESVTSNTFTYTFGEAECCVYFAHNMLYLPAHFDRFCQENGLKQQVFCISERGRKVPYVRFGNGKETILLTARHHACEATGSYVLEGVMNELLRELIPGFEIVVVPFVDYDGVVDGDQGKSRAPYDHNRDYVPNQESRYASVRRIREIAAEKPLRYAFDYHSPWHATAMNDWVYIVQKHYDILDQMNRFAGIWEKLITNESLPYKAAGTLSPDTDWNKVGTPCFGTYMHSTAGAEIAFTLETPYFKCLKNPGDWSESTAFSPEAARDLGRCFVMALREYHKS